MSDKYTIIRTESWKPYKIPFKAGAPYALTPFDDYTKLLYIYDNYWLAWAAALRANNEWIKMVASYDPYWRENKEWDQLFNHYVLVAHMSNSKE